MVACLEKSEGNVDFHKIVDFLTASSVHYALTQIHATVDGKTVVISESSVRNDLHFNDEDEPFNDVYQTPAHTKKVFTNMKRKGKDFSGRVTPLFASMLAPPVVEGEGPGQPSEPQPSPSTAQPRIEEQIPVTKSSSPQDTQSPRQALQEDTQFPQTSMPIPNVVDDTVFKEWDDRVVRATTTVASLDAAHASGNISKTQSTTMSNDPLSQEIGSGDRPRCQEAMEGVIAQTRSERASKHSYDSPLPGGYTPRSDEERIEQDDLTDFVPPKPHDSPLSGGGHTLGSDEGRPNINELMAIYANLSNRVLALEQLKTAQDLVIRKLKKKVRKLEKKLRARTLRMKLFKIVISKRRSLDEEYLDVDNTMENVEDDAETKGGIMLNKLLLLGIQLIPPVLMSIRPRTTSVVICDVEEEPRRATPMPTIQSQDKGKGMMVEPEPTPKNPIKAQIQRDAEIAQRLFKEEQAQFEREQRIATERAAEQEANDAALMKQIEDIQARMDVDELLTERLQQEEREQFTIEEKFRILMEIIAERKRFFAAQRAEQIRNKPPTRAQLRNKMVTYLKHMGKYTINQMKSKSFEEIQKLYETKQKWINDFVPIDFEVVKDNRKGKAKGSRKKTVAGKRTGEKLNDESIKRQKIEDDAKKEVLRAYLDIISGDDEVIIKSDGSTKSYKIFTEMLDDFDRQDVLDLYMLVKERFKTTSPEGYDKLLWGDIITIFEPSEDDDIWKAQQDYPLIS
ncbi:hypothetical protein Tco_0059771 [Tanacetum coccineum]